MRQPIDREALVRRHAVHVTAIDTSSPLTVGNGEFAFTADVTGLQTLNQSYRNPLLQTMSHWAWHTIPAAIAGIDPSKFTEQTVVVNNHTSHYPVSAGQPPALVAYLRSNPHRLNLGRLLLRRGVASTLRRSLRRVPSEYRTRQERTHATHHASPTCAVRMNVHVVSHAVSGGAVAEPLALLAASAVTQLCAHCVSHKFWCTVVIPGSYTRCRSLLR